MEHRLNTKTIRIKVSPKNVAPQEILTIIKKKHLKYSPERIVIKNDVSEVYLRVKKILQNSCHVVQRNQ